MEIDDKLHTGFYIIEGDWKSPFPFLDQLVHMELTNAFTVYVIDYSTPIAGAQEKSRISTIKSAISNPSSTSNKPSLGDSYSSDIPVSDKNRKNERRFSKEDVRSNLDKKVKNMKPKNVDYFKDPYMNELIRDVSFKIE